MYKSITVAICLISGMGGPGLADEITIRRGGEEQVLEGTILVEAQHDNGLMFQTADGRLWLVSADELESKRVTEESVAPIERKELGRAIQRELGKGFSVHEAGNFLIVYDTETAYARWVAGLYRRLERGFLSYWANHKFKLANKPDFPLAVIVFRNRSQYEQYMQRDIGGVNSSMIAYYNLETNRVVMFDLTTDETRSRGQLDDRKINQVLNNPRAIPMVATIVHEATHQLMFNYGMQTRFADTPLWINEGLAMYFETPDLAAARGWRAIGRINHLRLRPFLDYLRNRPPDSLSQMIREDDGFRAPEALNFYAQAWAFNYFLLNKHKTQYVEYLKHMSTKPRLISDTPDQRLQEFLQFFEISLKELDRQFVEYIRNLDR